jgi:hypothetical protein
MINSNIQRIVSFCLAAFLTFMAVPAIAGCINLASGSAFILTRDEPRFLVSNTVSVDGSVIEERVMTRNGSAEKVTTTYWNGVIAVDRKSSSSHIQLKMSEDAKLADLSEVGNTYSFPVSIFVNGDEVDRGSFVMETIQNTALEVGGCQYSVMVVRTTINRNNGDPINEEALLSLDAGMLLGNVAMTPDWQPKHGVFFDEVKAN